MKHFLIYTNKHKDQELATTKRIRNYLESKGCTVKLKVKESDWKAETESAAEEEATDIPLRCHLHSRPYRLTSSGVPSYNHP